MMIYVLVNNKHNQPRTKLTRGAGWGMIARSRDVPKIWNPTGIIRSRTKSPANSRQKLSPGNKFGEKDTLYAYLLTPQTYLISDVGFFNTYPKRVTRVTRYHRQKYPFYAFSWSRVYTIIIIIIMILLSEMEIIFAQLIVGPAATEQRQIDVALPLSNVERQTG